jgi:hypothetical protein
MRALNRVGREGGPGVFELVIMLFLAFGGASTITRLGEPGSISRVLSQPILTIWSVLLTLGAITAFTGIVWPWRETTALSIEQTGLVAVSGASMIYAVVLFSQVETISGASVLTAFVGGFGIASAWRSVQIYFRQKAIIELSREMYEDGGDRS